MQELILTTKWFLFFSFFFFFFFLGGGGGFINTTGLAEKQNKGTSGLTHLNFDSDQLGRKLVIDREYMGSLCKERKTEKHLIVVSHGLHTGGGNLVFNRDNDKNLKNYWGQILREE